MTSDVATEPGPSLLRHSSIRAERGWHDLVEDSCGPITVGGVVKD